MNIKNFTRLVILSFMINISYAQSYECDNNYNDCGTPEQSGGGGGGKGSVLIANTDLGDSYQHADDYDDDGIEDSSDNCMRQPNPYQMDYDGDGIGNMCDNCLYTFNPDQKDYDGDEVGNECDDDIDGDGTLNIDDLCIFHWGEQCSTLDSQLNNEANHLNNIKETENKKELFSHDIKKEDNIKNIENCNQKNNNNVFWVLLVLLVSLIFSKPL